MSRSSTIMRPQNMADAFNTPFPDLDIRQLEDGRSKLNNYTDWVWIGSGGFGRAYRATEVSTGQHVVIKAIDINTSMNFGLTLDDIVSEAKTSLTLSSQPSCHKYIVCTKDYFRAMWVPPPPKFSDYKFTTGTTSDTSSVTPSDRSENTITSYLSSNDSYQLDPLYSNSSYNSPPSYNSPRRNSLYSNDSSDSHKRNSVYPNDSFSIDSLYSNDSSRRNYPNDSISSYSINSLYSYDSPRRNSIASAGRSLYSNDSYDSYPKSSLESTSSTSVHPTNSLQSCSLPPVQHSDSSHKSSLHPFQSTNLLHRGSTLRPPNSPRDISSSNLPRDISSSNLPREKDTFFIVSEYIDSGPDYATISYRMGDSRQLLSFFYQLATGLSYIHSLGYAHRDIKLDNIKYDSRSKCFKYLDFGLSCSNLCRPTDGSLELQPPESKLKITGIEAAQAHDIWSLGVLMFSVANNREAYRFSEWSSYLRGEDELPKINGSDYNLSNPVVNSLINHTINSMLTIFWRLRPTAQMISKQLEDILYYMYPCYVNDTHPSGWINIITEIDAMSPDDKEDYISEVCDSLGGEYKLQPL